METQLFGVTGDPRVYAIGVAALPAASLLAAFLRARRPARIGPMRVLRAE